MKPKNILFLMGTYPSYGGVEIVSTVLANKFIEDGHHVTSHLTNSHCMRLLH